MSSRKSAPIVALHAVSFATPDGRDLFTDIDIAFGHDRAGLVGGNGIGKSTLLRLIAGELTPRSGTVERSGRIGTLRQSVQVDDRAPVADLLGVAEALGRLERLAEGRGSLDDAAEADWTLESRLAIALANVGLAGLDPARRLASLSGGERTRVALAALLLDDPDLLLLDEPTNNLDADGRAAIARVLAGWKKGAIVVSHDRALLRGMDRIVELSGLGARAYGGGYDLYAERKAA
ncbi:MAG: ATP-binding cassette domain-containing protein, partial [Bauldia litoralis]